MLFYPSDQRILQGSAATLTGLTYDQDGTLAAPSGTVTVEVVSEATGTVVKAAGSATTNPSTGTYQVTVTAAQTATLDRWEVRWTASGVRVATTRVDIVGSYWASVADVRLFDDQLSDASKYTNVKVIEARNTAEQLFEHVLGRAFTPRYAWDRFVPTYMSSLVLDGPDLRLLRSVRNYTDGTSFTSWTAAQLAAVPPSDTGVATRIDNGLWTGGTWTGGSVQVEWEHGQDYPPADLRRQLLRYIRHLLVQAKSGVPDRATSMTSDNGGQDRKSVV